MRQRRSQHGIDEDVDLRGRQAKGNGEHQPSDFADAGIAEAERRDRPPAGAPERRELDADMQHRPGHDADGEGADAEVRSKPGGGDDDRDVVEERRKRLREESLVGGEDADHHAPRAQEDWLQQQNASEVRNQFVVAGAVTEGDQRHVKWRDDPEDGGADRDSDDPGIQDPLANLERPLPLVLRQVFRQDGEEGRADRARQQQVEEQVRDRKGDAIVVQLMAGAKDVRDDQFADGTEDPTQSVGDQDERGGRRNAPPLARHRVPLSFSPSPLGEGRGGGVIITARMANTQSAKKRVRASLRKRNRNRASRSAVKTLVSRARRPAAGETITLTSEEARRAISALDKAAEKGVLHPNNASRRKSRLMAALAKIEPAAEKPQKTPARASSSKPSASAAKPASKTSKARS